MEVLAARGATRSFAPMSDDANEWRHDMWGSDLDINGFLLSTEVLAQLASIVTALITALVGDALSSFFGGA